MPIRNGVVVRVIPFVWALTAAVSGAPATGAEAMLHRLHITQRNASATLVLAAGTTITRGEINVSARGSFGFVYLKPLNEDMPDLLVGDVPSYGTSRRVELGATTIKLPRVSTYRIIVFGDKDVVVDLVGRYLRPPAKPRFTAGRSAAWHARLTPPAGIDPLPVLEARHRPRPGTTVLATMNVKYGRDPAVGDQAVCVTQNQCPDEGRPLFGVTSAHTANIQMYIPEGVGRLEYIRYVQRGSDQSAYVSVLTVQLD